METHILSINNKLPQFYMLLGKYLCNKTVFDELGYPLWDDNDKTWYIAMKGKKLAGFAYRRIAKDCYHLGGLYVLPECRKKGIGTSLLANRIKDVGVYKTTCTPASVSIHKKLGFVATGTKGKYTLMEYKNDRKID